MRIALIALGTAALALSLASQASALTLTNRDSVEQRLQITASDNEAADHDLVVAAEQTLEGLCESGCTIALPSGVQEDFDGYELVYIQNGRFVVAE